MSWADRSVLVTGATGFVGSWLTTRLLDEGASVVALVSDVDSRSEFARSNLADRITVIPGTLEDPGAAARAIIGQEVDTVFHLGAQTIVGAAQRDPVATFEINIRGTYLVLDACRQASDLVQRVVVASSDKAYGTSPELPYVESMPLRGVQPYEVSKSCTDLLAQSYAAAYELPVAVARCGNIYGGGDLNWSRIVPGTCRSLLRGETPILRSDGTFVRDILYVDDVVDAYLSLAAWIDSGEATKTDIGFNFSDESPRTVREIYDATCQAFGRAVEPKVLNRAAGEIKDQYLDAGRARSVLGWNAKVDLAEGLTRAAGWYAGLFGSA